MYLSNGMKTRGFTLIELLVVIAIIGLLSSVVYASLGAARAKARDAKRIADLKQVQLAMEMFYDSQGKYPTFPNCAPSWDCKWDYLRQCLTQGTNCGFTVTGYTPVISILPQDPLDKPGLNFGDPTYYYAYPHGCTSEGQSYRLGAWLETDHPALRSDLDGSIYNNNGWCEDSVSGTSFKGYCVGVGSCSGW